MKAKVFLILLIATFIYVDVNAQCAMCRAVVESNMEDGGTGVGKGLNNGILYLMAIPYLAVFVFAAIWYRKNLKAKQES